MLWSLVRRARRGSYPKKSEITCPAAEIVHPIFSPHPWDVNCNLNGRIRSASEAPCTGNYWNCRVWQINRTNEISDRNANHGETGKQAVRQKGKHTMDADKVKRDHLGDI